MTRARVRALAILAVLITAIAASALWFRSSWAGPGPLASVRIAPRPLDQRPTLLLLTSLPILFGEDFSIKANGSAALSALRTRYRVLAISVAEPGELAKGRLLLMAQPSAQPAEDLVALDSWVRSGGRLLLLADPALEWPSNRPLGDPLRPASMFMDTGLLAHWGLRLDAPDRRGPSARQLGGFEVLTDSPGLLQGKCRISTDRLVARCVLGRGRATVVADADFLDVPALGPEAAHNLDGLLGELALLEQK